MLKNIFLSLLICVSISSTTFAEIPSSDSDKTNGKGRVYMPVSVMNDHVVIGQEIDGYTMRYDLAQQLNNFMVLLPNEYDSFDNTPNYFAIDTLSLDGVSLKGLFDADIKGIKNSRPGTKVIRTIEHKIPINSHGQCFGAEVQYPSESAAFPNEAYFLCDAGSKKYAIVLSLNAKSRPSLSQAYPAFIKWIDVPQVVNDFHYEER